MTDNDIIKALDSADVFLRDRADTHTVPLNEYDIAILIDIANTCDEAVNLINRQKAEIERLEEIKNRLSYNLQAVLDERADHSEAVKEFAERLKKCSQWLPLVAMPDPFVIVSDIDNLVKEMVGEG
jgi:hypothetical protein